MKIKIFSAHSACNKFFVICLSFYLITECVLKNFKHTLSENIIFLVHTQYVHENTLSMHIRFLSAYSARVSDS
jgi:hypothetical protein